MTTIHWAVLIGGDVFIAGFALMCGWQIGRRAGLRQGRREARVPITRSHDRRAA